MGIQERASMGDGAQMTTDPHEARFETLDVGVVQPLGDQSPAAK